MLVCPECKNPLPNGVKHCVYCGTEVSTSPLVKQEKMVFFLSPIILLGLCISLTFELGVVDYIEKGMSLGVLILGLYFSGPALLLISKILLRRKDNNISYYRGAMLSVFNGILSYCCAFAIENYYYSEDFYILSPTELIQNRVLLTLILFYVSITITLGPICAGKDPSKKRSKARDFFALVLFLILPVTTLCFGLQLTTQAKFGFASESLLAIGANEQAERYINKALEKFPRDPKTCIYKSIFIHIADENLNNPEKKAEALKLAQIAVEEKPLSPMCNYILALQLEINSNSQEAMETALKAANLAITDTMMWMNYADLCFRHFKYDEAIAGYNRVLTLDANDAAPLNNLSYCYLLKEENLPQALEMAKRAVDLKPNMITYIDTLAWAHYKNKNYHEALEVISKLYEKVSSITPELDFHYAAILDSEGLLNNPVETYDKMLVKPEIATDKHLILQIIDARRIAEERESLKSESKN